MTNLTFLNIRNYTEIPIWTSIDWSNNAIREYPNSIESYILVG